MTAAPGAGLAAWSPRRRIGAAVVGGAVAGLGLAPFDLWLLTPLGLALLVALIGVASARRHAAALGWAAGAGYFAVVLHWIVEPFLVDAATHGWMAPFALVLFAGGLALFWATAGWVSAWLLPVGAARGVGFGAALVLAEAARGVVFTGFPWAMPGQSLIDTAYLGAAAWGGGLGLTALVVALAVAVALLARSGRGAVGAGALIALAFGGGIAVPRGDAPEAGAGAPVIRLVQPNAPQHLKWDPEMIPVFWDRSLSLTGAAPQDGLPPPDLVVWPETSLPVLLDRSDAARVELSRAAGAARVIVGAQRLARAGAHNSLALLAPDGRIAALYDKHRLVPFGEYVPFRDLVERWDVTGLAEVLPGGYSPGAGPATLDLGGGLGRAFAMICYEAIFARDLRQTETRPDWIVHITNDAWFGTFSGPWQHLAIARLRATEQGLPLLRAANTGVSAVIDARGQIVAQLDLGIAGYLDARLPPPLPPTVYARTGDAPILALVALLLIGAIVWGPRREGPLKPRR